MIIIIILIYYYCRKWLLIFKQQWNHILYFSIINYKLYFKFILYFINYISRFLITNLKLFSTFITFQLYIFSKKSLQITFAKVTFIERIKMLKIESIKSNIFMFIFFDIISMIWSNSAAVFNLYLNDGKKLHHNFLKEKALKIFRGS